MGTENFGVKEAIVVNKTRSQPLVNRASSDGVVRPGSAKNSYSECFFFRYEHRKARNGFASKKMPFVKIKS